MIKQNIESLDGGKYEMEVTDESTSEDGTTTDTISFSNNDGKGTIKLYDVRKMVPLENVKFHLIQVQL